MRRAMRLTFAIVLCSIALFGCASTPEDASQPEPDYRARAVVRTDGGLRVSTAVLSAEESEQVYGVPLASKSIQPVWVEIENREHTA